MGTGTLGLREAVSVALGGMIGGGIYAVLGVVTEIAGAATWAAFLLASVVAACAAYSFVGLNRLVVEGDDDYGGGGAVTFVRAFTGSTTLAGVVGWTLLVGYVGSMAMYAFAFGEFTVALPLVPEAAAGLPLRPVVSVLAVAGFVGLNRFGARATGLVEVALTGAKVAVLVAFGVAGVVYAVVAAPAPVAFGLDRLSSFSPVMAAAVAFVAFQGWQLLFYDQESLDDPLEQIPRAIWVAIPTAAAVYAVVAVATFALAPEALQSHPHTALTAAAATVGGAVGLASVAAVLLSLSALFSTGSAINATLFSAGYFAKGMLSADLLPDRAGDSAASGVPDRTVLLLGAVTAAFTVSGSLAAITSFASLTFIVVFGGACLLAVRRAELRTLPPVVGAVGATCFLVLMGYHLYTAERGTFYAVCALAVVVLGAELLYFERDVIEREVPTVDVD